MKRHLILFEVVWKVGLRVLANWLSPCLLLLWHRRHLLIEATLGGRHKLMYRSELLMLELVVRLAIELRLSATRSELILRLESFTVEEVSIWQGPILDLDLLSHLVELTFGFNLFLEG